MRGFAESRNHDGKGSRVEVAQMSGAEGGTGRCDMELGRAEELSEAADDAGTAGFLMLQLGNFYR